MDFRHDLQRAAFKREVESFIAEHWNPQSESSGWGEEGEASDLGTAAFEHELIEKRWHVLAWPKQFGGGGADVLTQIVFNEAMAYHRAPSGGSWCGTHLVGPTLMQYGSDEQLAAYLPGISDGSVVWAQCFSEPNAGSDLASLSTSGVRDGDEYVLNGQKIWTSGGHKADWAIVLARTDREAPKHRGISFFLVDLQSPGVTRRGIKALDNNTPFAEIFFEDVRVPVAQRIGEENRGWYVATTTLDFERSGIARIAGCRRDVADLVSLAKNISDRSPRTGIVLADLATSVEVGRLLSYRVGLMQNAGKIPNYEASVAKLFGSELNQRVAASAAVLLGMSFQAQREQLNVWPRRYEHRLSETIAAGTSEVQRNIIAQRGLGLQR